MNLRRGFQRITLILAILAGLVLAGFAGSMPFKKHRDASGWGLGDYIVVQPPSKEEKKEFDRWVQLKGIRESPDYFVLEDSANGYTAPTLNSVREKLAEQQKTRFWRDLSRPKLVTYCVMAGVGCGIAGFFGTWATVWFGGLGVYKLIRWLVSGFTDE